jgi:hypothetical protein
MRNQNTVKKDTGTKTTGTVKGTLLQDFRRCWNSNNVDYLGKYEDICQIVYPVSQGPRWGWLEKKTRCQKSCESVPLICQFYKYLFYNSSGFRTNIFTTHC